MKTLKATIFSVTLLATMGGSVAKADCEKELDNFAYRANLAIATYVLREEHYYIGYDKCVRRSLEVTRNLLKVGEPQFLLSLCDQVSGGKDPGRLSFCLRNGLEFIKSDNKSSYQRWAGNIVAGCPHELKHEFYAAKDELKCLKTEMKFDAKVESDDPANPGSDAAR